MTRICQLGFEWPPETMPRKKTTPRKRPKQERAHQTVEAILTAAAQLLVSRGYAGASTNRIAERAGVSIGSLYEYFPNKDAIVATLTKRLLEQRLEIIRSKLTELADAPLDRATREIIRALFHAKRIQPRLESALATGVPQARASIARQFNRRAREALLPALEARVPALRPRDLELAVFIIVNSLYGAIDAALQERPDLIDDDRFVDELATLALAYLEG